MSSDNDNSGAGKQVYKVRIFNQIYTITSSSTEAEFQQIADHVDLLMQTIASRSGTADGVRVGVLAAMHLADKLRQAERRLEAITAQSDSIRTRIDERTEQLDRLLRQTLESEAQPEAPQRSPETSPNSAEIEHEAKAIADTPSPQAEPVPQADPSPQGSPAEEASLSAETPPAVEARAARKKVPPALPDEDPSAPPLFPLLDWRSRATSSGE